MNANEPTIELRKWCFEQAMKLNQSPDHVYELIWKAVEIEGYILNGKNLRDELFCCVDTALSEVDCASIPEVSEASKRKTMVVVRKWLKEYHAQ